MNAEIVLLSQGQNLGQRVDGSQARGADSYDDRTYVTFFEHAFNRVGVHSANAVHRNRGEGNPQYFADSAVGVVGLFRCNDLLSRVQPASDPQRLEVGHRAAAGQVAQWGAPAKHLTQFGDALLLHGRAGAAAVQCMIVRVDPKRQRVCDSGNRVRRLEHLPCVLRMVVGVVILHTHGYFLEDIGNGVFVERRRECRQVRAPFLEFLERRTQ